VNSKKSAEKRPVGISVAWSRIFPSQVFFGQIFPDNSLITCDQVFWPDSGQWIPAFAGTTGENLMIEYQ